MIYPEKQFESKLNFNQIKEWIEDACTTVIAKEMVSDISFKTDIIWITEQQEKIKCFKQILDNDALYPRIFFDDIRPLLQKAKVTNSFLEPEEFHQLRSAIQLFDNWYEFLNDESFNELYAPLFKEIEGMEKIDFLISVIDLRLDSKGKVRDDATEYLQEIRREIRIVESRVRNSMQGIYKTVKEKGYLAEQSEITIRNGRLVIPLAAENKRVIKGFIHDHSATGQTAYIEPAEIFDMNNELEDIINEERKEVIRILIDLSSEIRPYFDQIRSACHFLARMDLIRAKGRLAQKIDAGFPKINKSSRVNIKDARHPILWVNHKELNKEVIPLSIQLDENNRIIIVSGPNAGGKSVALKTIGLCFYMLQSGLPVALSSESSVPVFKDIFIDIGDEQSIENDLSTYSSHLANMREMLNAAGGKSLILIDEFGTGTDPQFGGAIAEAILDKLNHKKVMGMINTHYSNLKAFGEKTAGIVNAAMLFDVENLAPLYELKLGKPGSSFAFEVADKIGLPKDILDSAKENIGYSQIEYDKLLTELENEKRELKELNDSLIHKDADLEKVVTEYRELRKKLKEDRQKLIEEAKKEAAGIVKGANKRIEKTIREIREKQADKKATKEIRKSLEDYKSNTEKKQEKKKKAVEPEFVELAGPINVGDIVEVVESGARAEVIAIKGKDVELAIGALKSKSKISKLKKLGKVNQKNKASKTKSSNLGDFNSLNFSRNIDLRGKRKEDALRDIDNLIDKAILAGATELSILHGKGDGILRTEIRKYLKTFSQVDRYESEHVERGGDGITIVYLK